MTEAESWRTRGSADLPGPLRRWVAVDPAWRIVKIESGTPLVGEYRAPLYLTLIHVLNGLDFHAIREPVASWEPADMKTAVLAALVMWWRTYGTP